jgi:hypothetical protein
MVQVSGVSGRTAIVLKVASGTILSDILNQLFFCQLSS